MRPAGPGPLVSEWSSRSHLTERLLTPGAGPGVSARLRVRMEVNGDEAGGQPRQEVGQRTTLAEHLPRARAPAAWRCAAVQAAGHLSLFWLQRKPLVGARFIHKTCLISIQPILSEHHSHGLPAISPLGSKHSNLIAIK